MSLYQCAHCGCVENTALAMQPGYDPDWFDWVGIEARRGQQLCSACMPTKYSDGTATRGGQWHQTFERRYLPLGEWKTGFGGNLTHKKSGSQDWHLHVVEAPNDH